MSTLSVADRRHQTETIRARAARLGLSLAEASRLRSLENVRSRLSQIEAGYSLALLTVIFFCLGFAVAYQA